MCRRAGQGRAGQGRAGRALAACCEVPMNQPGCLPECLPPPPEAKAEKEEDAAALERALSTCRIEFMLLSAFHICATALHRNEALTFENRAEWKLVETAAMGAGVQNEDFPEMKPLLCPSPSHPFPSFPS